MVQGPVDYSINAQDPFVEGLKGYKAGQEVQLRGQQTQLLQQLLQRREQMKTDLADFSSRQNKTRDDYERMMLAYPELKDQMTAAIGRLSEEQKNEKVNQMLPLYAALKSGNTEAARQVIGNLEQAYKSSGMEEEAQNLNMINKNLDIDPKGALTSTELFLFNADPEKFLKLSQATQKMEGGGEKAKKQKTGSFIVRDEKNAEKLVTGSYDPNTGTLDIISQKLPGQLLSNLGETATEQTERRITEAEQKKRSETKAQSEEARFNTIIDNGLTASESIPRLKRSIDLLKSVKTGGFNYAANRAKQMFGIESADEAELNNRLSTEVLKALKPTFGSAFTREEAAGLERISANFGKSTEGNIRILSQLLKEFRRKANRGLVTAKRRGDTETVNEINNWLNATDLYGENTSQNQGETTQQQQPIQINQGERTATNPRTGQKAVFRNGQWLDVNSGQPLGK